MNDIPECTEKELADQQQQIFKGMSELDWALRKKKKYEQKMKLVVVPIAVKQSDVPEFEDSDDDVIIMEVIDLTKDDN